MKKLIATVHGNKISVVTSGNEQGAAIVFLAGSGVSSPALEYKKLAVRFEGKHQTATVEKLGYGYSDSSTGSPRDIETLVAQSREALAEVGVKPPYVLVPHSYSGIEALYWAAKYPEEVSAILGLDMVTPNMAMAQAKEIPQEKLEQMLEGQKKLFVKIKKSKLLQKLFRNKLVNVSGIMKDKFYTDEEKAEYQRLFYQNLGNPEIGDEMLSATDNAAKLLELGEPKCCGFMFITDMKNPMVKATTWLKENSDYAESVGFKWQKADTTHFLYNTITDEIASAWLEFMSENGI